MRERGVGACFDDCNPRSMRVRGDYEDGRLELVLSRSALRTGVPLPESGDSRSGLPIFQCRRRRAADDGRCLVNERVVFQRLDHEQREIDATCPVAGENRVADVPAPHRKALALALLQITSAYDRPPGIAREDPAGRLNLAVEIA